MNHRIIGNTPLGRVYLQSSDAGLQGLWFEDQKYVPDSFEPTLDESAFSSCRNSSAAVQILHETKVWLERYFDSSDSAQPEDKIRPKLKPTGTDFQQSVWTALLQIPMGSTVSYGELAQLIGKPEAVRAVAAAIGKNPISLIIPCHRVIGANGSLTGYAGGLSRKEQLLSLEGALGFAA